MPTEHLDPLLLRGVSGLAAAGLAWLVARRLHRKDRPDAGTPDPQDNGLD